MNKFRGEDEKKQPLALGDELSCMFYAPLVYKMSWVAAVVAAYCMEGCETVFVYIHSTHTHSLKRVLYEAQGTQKPEGLI